jgi:hypothetical protein
MFNYILVANSRYFVVRIPTPKPVTPLEYFINTAIVRAGRISTRNVPENGRAVPEGAAAGGDEIT